MKKYGKYYSECRRTLRSMLYYYSQKEHYKIGVWGAGLKGKAFLRIIDPSRQFIDYVYDVDQAKLGTVMPTGHQVVNYKDKNKQDVKVVLLMNNNFETDTAVLLEEEKMDVILINVDSVMAGGLTAKEIVTFHRKEK